MKNFKKAMKMAGICSMAVVMMAGLAGCGGKAGNNVSSGAKNAAKIGFTAALTGGAAAYGKSEEEGVRLAVEEINEKGDFPIDLMVDDTKAVPAEAMNATKKQIQDKASILIGPMTSNEAKAAGPIIQNAKVPSLEISVTAENITDMGDCIFRNSVPESKNIPQTVKKTHQLLGYQKAAIMYAHDNEQHVTAQKYFKKTMEEEGVEVVDVETFGSKDSEFSAQLTNIQTKNPDVIVVCSYYQEGSRILKKMREMGMNQPVLGDNGFMSPELVKIAGPAADNVYVSSMWSPDRDSEATRKFVKDFRERYNHDPDNFAACAYVSAKLAAKAMENAGTTTDSKKVRDALAHIKNFESAAGPMTFNNSGDPEVDLVLLKVEDGKYKAVKV